MRNDLLCIDVDSIVFDTPEPGCVLCLPGLPGGGSKICDRSPYGNHGAITGATWSVLPSGLWYLSFDGSDDIVSCGGGPSFDIADYQTIKLWVKPDSLTQDAVIITNGVPGGGGDAACGISLAIYNASDEISLGVPASKKGLDGIATYLTAGKWQHWVHTYTATGPVFTFILDGVNRALDTVTDAWSPSSSTFDIGGRDRGGVMSNFAGDIALVEVHHGLWSALEAQNNFNQEKHLFGVWPFT